MKKLKNIFNKVNPIYFVYIIENMKNQRKYIGQTINPKQRWREHKLMRSYKNGNYNKLYKAMRKYGIENFSFSIIERCHNKKRVNELEICYIKKFNTYKKGYNSTLGGNYTKDYRIGKTKEQIEEINKKKANKASKNGMYNKTHTKEVKKILAKAAIKTFKGKSYEELYGSTTAKNLKKLRSKVMKKHRKENPLKGSKNPNAKSVELIDPNGEKFIINGELEKFCKNKGLWSWQIICMLKGRKPNHRGWTGKYLN